MLGSILGPTIMENQMEKKMENEIGDYMGFRVSQN